MVDISIVLTSLEWHIGGRVHSHFHATFYRWLLKFVAMAIALAKIFVVILVLARSGDRRNGLAALTLYV